MNTESVVAYHIRSERLDWDFTNSERLSLYLDCAYRDISEARFRNKKFDFTTTISWEEHSRIRDETDFARVTVTTYVITGKEFHLLQPQFFGRFDTMKYIPGLASCELVEDDYFRDRENLHWTHEDQQRFDEGFWLLSEFAGKDLDFVWPHNFVRYRGQDGDFDLGGVAPVNPKPAQQITVNMRRRLFLVSTRTQNTNRAGYDDDNLPGYARQYAVQNPDTRRVVVELRDKAGDDGGIEILVVARQPTNRQTVKIVRTTSEAVTTYNLPISILTNAAQGAPLATVEVGESVTVDIDNWETVGIINPGADDRRNPQPKIAEITGRGAGRRGQSIIVTGITVGEAQFSDGTNWVRVIQTSAANLPPDIISPALAVVLDGAKNLDFSYLFDTSTPIDVEISRYAIQPTGGGVIPDSYPFYSQRQLQSLSPQITLTPQQVGNFPDTLRVRAKKRGKVQWTRYIYIPVNIPQGSVRADEYPIVAVNGPDATTYCDIRPDEFEDWPVLSVVSGKTYTQFVDDKLTVVVAPQRGSRDYDKIRISIDPTHISGLNRPPDSQTAEFYLVDDTNNKRYLIIARIINLVRDGDLLFRGNDGATAVRYNAAGEVSEVVLRKGVTGTLEFTSAPAPANAPGPNIQLSSDSDVVSAVRDETQHNRLSLDTKNLGMAWVYFGTATAQSAVRVIIIGESD